MRQSLIWGNYPFFKMVFKTKVVIETGQAVQTMLSGIARKPTSLSFELCLFVISCLYKAWSTQKPFVVVWLWPLYFGRAWLSRCYLFEKWMFTCYVYRQELLAYLLIKAVIASAHTVCFGTVQQYHFIFIDNSTYALFFLLMSFRKHI